jgi:hypothetical protein
VPDDRSYGFHRPEPAEGRAFQWTEGRAARRIDCRGQWLRLDLANGHPAGSKRPVEVTIRVDGRRIAVRDVPAAGRRPSIGDACDDGSAVVGLVARPTFRPFSDLRRPRPLGPRTSGAGWPCATFGSSRNAGREPGRGGRGWVEPPPSDRPYNPGRTKAIRMDPKTPPLEEPGRAGRRLSAVFFATTFLLLLAFSPGHIAQMGYTPEILEAGRRLLDRGEAILNGMPGVQGEIPVTRHGFGELAAALPFLTAARIAFGSSAEWANRALSLQPVLSTALICTVLFAWTRRLTGSAAWGVALGLLAGFSTMLWPYAYIGLETTQSLFLLLAGFLPRSDGPPTWPRTLLFAACGAALSRSDRERLSGSRARLARRPLPTTTHMGRRVRLKFLVVAFTVAAV